MLPPGAAMEEQALNGHGKGQKARLAVSRASRSPAPVPCPEEPRVGKRELPEAGICAGSAAGDGAQCGQGVPCAGHTPARVTAAPQNQSKAPRAAPGTAQAAGWDKKLKKRRKAGQRLQCG